MTLILSFYFSTTHGRCPLAFFFRATCILHESYSHHSCDIQDSNLKLYDIMYNFFNSLKTQ